MNLMLQEKKACRDSWFRVCYGIRCSYHVLGTSPNPLISSTTKGLDINKRKCIVAEEETGKTSKEGVYAGGDAVTGAATVILAMGAGKAGAKGIDEFLSNN